MYHFDSDYMEGAHPAILERLTAINFDKHDGYGCDHMQLGYVADALAGLGFHTGLWTEGALNRINWEVGHAGSRVQKIDVAWSGPAYQHALSSALNRSVSRTKAREDDDTTPHAK